MVNFSKGDPLGLESVSRGAARIREIKLALEAALGEEHYFPNSLNMYHKFPLGNAVTGYEGRWRYNDTDQVIEAYLSGAWTAITKISPVSSGTKMLFFQAAAPTGWTKNTLFGNDVALRILGSGAIGSGGSWSPQTSTSATTHTHGGTVSTETMTIEHTQTEVAGDAPFQPFDFVKPPISSHIVSHNHTVTANGAHFHTIDSSWRPAYVDVIVCSKD
jgi:hypothetical protein